MKKYYSFIYFILTAAFFSISLILNFRPEIQGFAFVILLSSIGILIGNYYRVRKNITLTERNKKLITGILVSSIIICILIIFLVDSILIKQILICSLILAASIISALIVFRKKNQVSSS